MTPATKETSKQVPSNATQPRSYDCDGCGKQVPGVHSHEWTLESGTPDGSFCCSCMRCEFDCFADALPFVPGVL